MLDIKDLEQRWGRYNAKRKRPLYIIITLSIIATGVATFWTTISPKPLALIDRVTANVSTEKSVPAKVSIIPVETMSNDYNQNVLKPNMSFALKVENIIVANQNKILLEKIALEKKISQKEHARIQAELLAQKKARAKTLAAKKRAASRRKKEKEKRLAATKKKKTSPPKKSTTVPVKSSTIVLAEPKAQKTAEISSTLQIQQDKTSQDELNSVIKRYNKHKNPALSLFIARKYYGAANYQEAYNWTQETNALNPNIEDNIIINAKSLVKLGKTQKAITSLNSYTQKTGSLKAKKLLSQINEGSFQ